MPMYPAGQKNTPKITDAPRQSNIIQVIRAATQSQPYNPKLSVITGTMLNCPTPPTLADLDKQHIKKPLWIQAQKPMFFNKLFAALKPAYAKAPAGRAVTKALTSLCLS